MSGDEPPIQPGGALEGALFGAFIRDLSQIRELAPGDEIGPWRIKRELGRGGNGVVYLAERADGAFTREVALKWLRGDRPMLGARRALERERELLAGLDHPHIARLIDGGRTDEGMLWFAMDYVSGERIDLHALTLPLPDRAELIRSLCQAVHHAHSRGLIHGDIKPANVLVDDLGQPRLLDFGISRIRGARGNGYGLTPEFASPEQKRGEALTTASDVWQLGRLLETVLAGRHVPRDLAAIVAKAKAEDTPVRYHSAAALAADLAAWRQRRPVEARGGGSGYRLRRFINRHQAISALAAASLLIITGGGAWFTWQLAHERDLARGALAETQAALVRAEALREFLTGLFRAVQPDRPRHQLPSTEEILASGAKRAMDPEAAEPAERAGMLLTIADVYLQHHRIGDARPLLEEAAAVARDARRFKELAEALISQAEIAAFQGDFDDVNNRLNEVEQLIEYEAIPRSTSVRARVLRATMERFFGNHERMLALLEPLHEEMAGSEDTDLDLRILVAETLSAAYGSSGDLEKALAIGIQETGLRRRRDGRESLAFANAVQGVAWHEELLGRFESAEARVREAIEIQQAIFNRRNIYQASAYRQLAGIMLYSGRFDEALEYTRMELEERAAATGADLHGDERFHLARGIRLAEMHRWSEAATSLAQAQGRYAEPGILPRTLHAPPEALLAKSMCHLHRTAEGEAVLETLTSRLEESAPPDPGYHSHISEARAVCRLASGDPTAALVAINQALAVPDPPGRAMNRAARKVLRARTLSALGHHAEAIQDLDRAQRLFLDAGLNNHPYLTSIENARQELPGGGN